MPLLVGALALIAAALALVVVSDPLQARAAALAASCLVLWLGEAVPPFVPSLLLLAIIPMLFTGPAWSLPTVLGWMADPVLVLFLGGFALSAAAQRHGIDAAITALALRWSGGRRLRLLALVMAATALLSMWMSNLAAAGMMLAALRPMIAGLERRDPFRAALLVTIAMAANLGGMATPIGSAPNAIAMAALEASRPLSLLDWMLIGLPTALVLLGIGFGLLVLRYRLHVGAPLLATTPVVPVPPRSGRWWAVAAVFSAMVGAWLSEPLHGVPVAVVAAAGTAALFMSGLLGARDLAVIDWSTLLLIAGGLVLGRLLQESGCIAAAAGAIDWQAIPSSLRLALWVGAAALMSAVMSNTATATMLIPLAAAIDPSPLVPVLIALGCSLGMPFSISTPPNALVYGQGLRLGDLLLPGVVFMALGCIAAAILGAVVLG